MHCYLPSFCFFPLAALVVITGIIYALLFGRMTGFYSVAVGMLFVISGFFGLFASGWRSYVSSLFFAVSLALSCTIAVAVNGGGLILPQYFFLLDSDQDALKIGGLTLNPNNYWFGIGLFYLTLVYIPLLSFAVCNACTIGKVIERAKKRKRREEEKKKRKDGFFMYRGNTLKNRIRPEDFGRIRAELNKSVHTSLPPSSPVKEVKIVVEP
ncbi:hypothetical protein EHI8A_085540 [Entamoeba histolytica HM-1:IMSS-B]|uniref:Uncharacterized protein n=8 Tax=Entamoeba histolytica TaxID=5759 RepID=C4M1T7_ENTH1|nr:hypothetical protein EHI_027490 [Entamoeba histolytica HM-1:IMSS]EMD45890.1 Hypothetical protein EHI5A_071780 [Entamoeba histolytica KU27]EMH75550.1 hypothetical protein EHI8A_085540 [Entamoeba histolytica HM-1:IMSS-B]ENY62402.1 hypothetical protein EHI7A_083750 [Entamoeba histolytica HM-1:IMSS-A]GAT95202.1 hypothetical protein CL6EHI_027490 [Entamoeba histolytica]EAL49517.2 hypothetical protein EHI_027490 [Entamoeba histolytica HM-1:IMSS]|eukprot:XP_654905.2 hypothetical protein EHI_027490 [Entamoeba histolytica HM-1:IMSS]